MDRLRRFYPDPVILFCVILLSLMGFLAMLSVRVSPHIFAELEFQHFKKPLLFLFFTFLGLFLMSAVAYFLDYKKLNNQRLVYYAVVISLFMLLAVIIKKLVLGKSVDRWLVGTSIQPSELSKIILVVFVSYYVARKGAIDNIKFFGWAIAVVVAHGILLFFQPDKGMAIFIFVVAWAMLWAGGTSYKIYLPAMGIFIIFILIGMTFLSGGYVYSRILAWIDPTKDSFGSGYQVIQALLSFMNGGLLGQGYGKGFQKLGPLTQADTDYVLATVGEELGFPGIVFVFVLFVVMVYRLLRISHEVVDTFGKLIVFGIMLNIAMSAVINVAMAVNLLPPKGIPLPFVSYGISNLLVNMLALGVVGAIYKRQLHYRML